VSGDRERSHVGERPADPLTVEAFVSTAAEFTLRHAGTRVGLSARRERGRLVFEASEALATFVLRVRDTEPPVTVTADGQALARLEGGALDRAERGWTSRDRTVIVKARARQFRVE